MAEKAETAERNNKNIIVGICIGALILIVIIVAVIFATRDTKLSDAYFVSDDTKYVLTVTSDQLNYEEEDNEEFSPVKTHVVYYYSGDTITGVITYMEYADEAIAKAVFDVYKNEDQEDIKNVSLNGKYLAVEMAENQYSDMTASDVKQQIEFMEMLNNIDFDEEEAIDIEEDEE